MPVVVLNFVVVSVHDKGKFRVIFDQTNEAGSGFLLGVYLQPISTSEIATVTNVEGSKVKYEELNAMLHHPRPEIVQKMTKLLGIEVDGLLEKCHNCATAKMKQMNISKENKNEPAMPEKGCISIQVL